MILLNEIKIKNFSPKRQVIENIFSQKVIEGIFTLLLSLTSSFTSYGKLKYINSLDIAEDCPLFPLQ
jgi:hypothetical protein